MRVKIGLENAGSRNLLSGLAGAAMSFGHQVSLLLHRWIPLTSLWIGLLALCLKWLFFMWIDLSISGGLVHMGYKFWALPAYAFAVIVMGGLVHRFRDVGPGSKWWENWIQTVVLILASVVAVLVAARGVVLWNESPHPEWPPQ
jgi:hypothetical protein